jgi:hypothetical protein
VADLMYQSEELRRCVQDWGRAHGIDVGERLVDVLVDRFEASTATVVDARPEADTLLISLLSPAWAGHKELAILPTGGVAW